MCQHQLSDEILLSFSPSPAKRAQLLPLDDKARPSLVLLRHHSRPVHARLGLHPRELQAGLPGERHRVLRAGPDRPVHHLSADQLPAPAAGREPAGPAAQRHLPAAQDSPGLCQAHATLLDDAGPGARACTQTTCLTPSPGTGSASGPSG